VYRANLPQVVLGECSFIMSLMFREHFWGWFEIGPFLLAGSIRAKTPFYMNGLKI
jgi:hypothetical protein